MISIPRLHTSAKSSIGKKKLRRDISFNSTELNNLIPSLAKPGLVHRYGVDFGKSEEEVLKHASTYLEPQLSEALLDLLVDTQFRVVYQQYDWGLNN